jgi:hypothetical protein
VYLSYEDIRAVHQQLVTAAKDLDGAALEIPPLPPKTDKVGTGHKGDSRGLCVRGPRQGMSFYLNRQCESSGASPIEQRQARAPCRSVQANADSCRYLCLSQVAGMFSYTKGSERGRLLPNKDHALADYLETLVELMNAPTTPRAMQNVVRSTFELEPRLLA